MTVYLALPLSLLLAAAALAAAWAVQYRTRDASVADVAWSYSVAGLGLFYAAVGQADVRLRVLLAVLAGLWGLRLGTYLLWRARGRPEDGRYRRLRERWGKAADRRLFVFFQIQALIAWLLSLSFAVIAWRPTPAPAWAAGLAVAIWLVAVVGEAIADRQLERFRRDPANRGRVCRQGLWRYSRHPNYFFECLHWCAYLPLALGAPWGGLALAAPLLMAWLLLKLSGVPATEAQAAASRPEYAEYLRTTSALIPWPPRKP
jgi:steroid 5-alpha reductase family enzyme